MLYKIEDWDDAYDNGNNIPSGHQWPGLWQQAAAQFRETAATHYKASYDLPYGSHERQHFDLLQPQAQPKGLIVFVHGGFWHKLDKSYFTHLARGCLENGWAVAIPSYRLCPEVRVTEISADMEACVEKTASLVEGPIRLIGHSAGGHLVSMMISQSSTLARSTQARILHTVSVSGLHDLRPLTSIRMNSILNIDASEAAKQSPALLLPIPRARLTCWVGAAERSEFLRQNDLLANIWKGLGTETNTVHQPDRHHFNILDDLTDKSSTMVRTLLV